MSNSDATEDAREQITKTGLLTCPPIPDRRPSSVALKTVVQRLEQQEEYSIVTKDLSKQDYVVIKPFRDGAARPCNLHVWETFKSKIGSSSPNYFEKREGVTRGEVHRLNHGLMSTEVQYALLSSLEGSQLGDLDPLPLLRERAIRGYQMAIFSLENRVCPETLPHPDQLIPEQVLIVLLRLVTLAVFVEVRDQCLNDSRELTEEEWTLLGGHLARELELNEEEFKGQIGITRRKNSSVGQQLETLHRRWGALVSRCRNAIPWNWLDER